MIRSPGFKPGPLGRGLRVDEADLDAQFRVVAHEQHAQEARSRCSICGAASLISLNSSTLSPRFTFKEICSPSYLGRKLCRSWAWFRTGLPSASTMLSPDLQADLVGRRVRGDGVDGAAHRELVGLAEGDAEHARPCSVTGLSGVPSFSFGTTFMHVLERDGEADADVVPLEAGGLVVARR